MGDTYSSASEADADRVQQRHLLAALNAWDRALRRDECGAWCVRGNFGSIHTWGDGKTWALYATCCSAQHWTWAKKKLSFCSVTQDGDYEGVLWLHQLPTPEQASVIRNVLCIQKRREVTAEVLERLKAFAFERKPRNEPSVEPDIGGSVFPVPEVPPDKTPILDEEPA